MKINELLLSNEDELLIRFEEMFPAIAKWKLQGISYFHFVCLDNNAQSCIFHAGYTKIPVYGSICFQQLLTCVNLKSYSDLLLLTTFYRQMDHELLINRINNPLQSGDPISQALFGTVSKGYLAFAHQLEQIYAASTLTDTRNSILFRRGWNKKHTKTRQEALVIPFGAGQSLMSYIEENSFDSTNIVFPQARFYQARLLFEWASR